MFVILFRAQPQQSEPFPRAKMSVVMVDDTVGNPKLITGPVPCFTPR